MHLVKCLQKRFLSEKRFLRKGVEWSPNDSKPALKQKLRQILVNMEKQKFAGGVPIMEEVAPPIVYHEPGT